MYQALNDPLSKVKEISLECQETYPCWHTCRINFKDGRSMAVEAIDPFEIQTLLEAFPHPMSPEAKKHFLPSLKERIITSLCCHSRGRTALEMVSEALAKLDK